MQDDSISVAFRAPTPKILEQQGLGDRFEVTVMHRRGDGTYPSVGGLPPKSMTKGCNGSNTGG